MKRYDHLARAVFDTPWMIHEPVLAMIATVLRMRMAGVEFTDDEIRERLATAAAANGPRRGGGRVETIAVIPIYGLLIPRGNLMAEMSGATSVASIREDFRAAMKDEKVTSILFDVDSAGGQVDGIEELAAEIRAARGRKPMVAVANTMMASGAYYLSAQADEILASPSSVVGSIGVITVHQETSRKDEMDGFTNTVIKTPPAKAEANGFEPLTPEAKAAIKQRIDDYYVQFVSAVAKGRGVSAAEVRAGYGEGRVLTAKRAVAAGLADRVGTFDDAIARLATGKVAPRITASANESEVIRVATLVHDDETEEILHADEDGLFTVDLGDSAAGESLPAAGGADEADQVELEALELARIKHRAHAH